MSEPVELISAYLGEVRRRLRILHCVRDGGLFLGGMALVMLPLLLFASQVEYLALVRVVGITLAVVCSGFFGVHLMLGLRRLGHDTALARYVGGRRPGLFSDLLSTVELQRETAPFSPALFRELARETWTVLSRQPPGGAVTQSQLRPAAVLVAFAAVAWAGAATSFSSQLQHGTRKLFAVDDGEHGQIASEPLVGDLKLTYQYPQHMGRAPRVVASSTGHITAPRGTMVRIQTTALVPIREAALRVWWRGDPKQLRLSLGGDQSLDARLPVSADGHYRFELRTARERVVLDPIRHRIDLEPDSPPRATVYGPANDIEVTARHRLEVGYAVDDDYGVARVSLLYQVGPEPAVRRELWRSGAERKRNVVGGIDWDLGLIDLPPGARLAYWIEAQDNDAVSGQKTGRSAARYVRIYSAEEKHAQTVAHQQALVEQSIRVLADRLLLFEKEPDISPALRLEKNHSVHRANSILVDGLLELRNKMRQDPLVPRASLRSISQMHQRLAGVVEREGTLLRSLEATRRRHQVRATHLPPLREHNREAVVEMERDVLLLANLLDEQRLQSLMALARQLQDARKRLADLLETYSRTRDEKLRQEILRQIQRIERQVTELLAQISKLRTSIPDEYLNREAMKNLDLLAELRRGSALLRDGKVGELQRWLQNLDRKLQQVQGLLEGNLQQYRSGRMSAREKAYGALLDRLRGYQAEQRQLADRTAQVIQRYRRRAAALMKNTVNPFVRRELAKLEALRKRVGEVESKTLSPYDQEQLDRVRQRVDDLKGMLDQGDLEEALQMARRTNNGLQLLQDDLADELDGPYSLRKGKAQRTLQRLRAARKIAGELVNDLEGIFPNPRSLLDGDDLREVRDVQRGQQALRKRVQDAASELEGASSPFVGPETPRLMREAAELMSKALGKLRSLQLQEAQSAQDAAAEQFAQLQRKAQQSRQPRDGAESGSAGMRERIEIPGADSFHPPREFRQDIMDAMKERPPSPYRPQVKRYYEELVR